MEKRIAENIAVIIPCFNVSKTIEDTVISVYNQTVTVKKILCIDDCSSDSTYPVLLALKKTNPDLSVLRCQKKRFRAGALNTALRDIPSSISYILIIDADTVIKEDLIQAGLSFFEKYKNVGGVCSRAGLKKGKGFLYRLQKLEYGAGFDAERTATFENVMVLHGMCTMFRHKALTDVGGFSEGHLIEDYDITLRLKEKGYRAMYNPNMEAFTEPSKTLFGLLQQRIRWSRGGVDIILGHGVSVHTAGDVLDHIFFLMLFFLICFVVITSATSVVSWRYQPHPIALTLGFLTYFIHVYRIKFVRELDWKDVLLRIILIPEIILSILLSTVQIWAYVLTMTHAKKQW